MRARVPIFTLASALGRHHVRADVYCEALGTAFAGTKNAMGEERERGRGRGSLGARVHFEWRAVRGGGREGEGGVGIDRGDRVREN
jgi:hypothetical protein